MSTPPAHIDPARVSALVEAVLSRLQDAPTQTRSSRLARITTLATAPPARPASPGTRAPSVVYADMDAAVNAAASAFRALSALPLATRTHCIEAMRGAARVAAPRLAEMAVAETRMGRVDDKIQKNLLVARATPGPEDLEPRIFTGDHGMTVEELAPLGVLASITPSTNPSETVINNAISMVSAGNAVVFGPHPGAKGVSHATVELMNRAIVEAGGPSGLVTAIAEPSIGNAQKLMRHPKIRALVVTGGPAVVNEALASGKKVFGAGPGNPPVVVDETADFDKAGREIVAGASFDNNIICTDEKEVFVVDGAAQRLKDAMRGNGAYEVTGALAEKLRAMVLATEGGPRAHAEVKREWVGQDATKILAALGVQAPPSTRLIIVETPVDHPFVWTELLMPVLAIARVRHVDEGIDLAVQAEHGYRHTASMWSRNIEKLSTMARAIDCSIFVKNGPNFAGLGFGGEGFTSFSIAGRTGEGMTTARTFTRRRRCVLVDYFRIV